MSGYGVIGGRPRLNEVRDPLELSRSDASSEQQQPGLARLEMTREVPGKRLG